MIVGVLPLDSRDVGVVRGIEVPMATWCSTGQFRGNGELTDMESVVPGHVNPLNFRTVNLRCTRVVAPIRSIGA